MVHVGLWRDYAVVLPVVLPVVPGSAVPPPFVVPQLVVPPFVVPPFVNPPRVEPPLAGVSGASGAPLGGFAGVRCAWNGLLVGSHLVVAGLQQPLDLGHRLRPHDPVDGQAVRRPEVLHRRRLRAVDPSIGRS